MKQQDVKYKMKTKTIKMKKMEMDLTTYNIFMRACVSFLLIITVINVNAQGTWTQKADWTGCYAQSNTAVVVGDKAYVGLGTAYCRDWKEYNPTNNTWTDLDTLPSPYSETVMGFGINDKAYILTSGGYINNNNSTYDHQNELWEYDTNTGDWTYLNNMPGNPVNHAASFSINGKGYIVGGAVPSGNWTMSIELWEYDPLNNTWTNKAPYIGTPANCQVSFVIDGIAYVGGGMTNSSVIPSEFYKYNPLTNQWSQIVTCPKVELFAASAFALNGRGYVGMGLSIGNPENPQYVWEYNPINDEWLKITDIPDQCIWDEGVGFAINGKGYMGMGDVTCNHLPMGYYPYFWEYAPVTTPLSISEEVENISVEILPTVTTGKFEVKIDTPSHIPFTYEVMTIEGKRIKREFEVYKKNIDITSSNDGIYLIKIEVGGTTSIHKVIKNEL